MRLITMLIALPSVVHWLRAFYAYKKGAIDKALAHYERFARWKTPEPPHEAFRATLLILQHRYEDARMVFQSVIDQLGSMPPSTENDRYVLCYSRYYAALIDRTDAECFRLAAQRTSPDRYVSRWLCLPEEAVF